MVDEETLKPIRELLEPRKNLPRPTLLRSRGEHV